MNEQEKREKAIEELHSILLDSCPGSRVGTCVCPRNTCSECAAMIIYDHYILHKEEEVRKELLKELADKAEQYGGVLPLRVLRNMLKEETK